MKIVVTSQYCCINNFDLTRPLKGPLGSSGVHRPHFENCFFRSKKQNCSRSRVLWKWKTLLINRLHCSMCACVCVCERNDPTTTTIFCWISFQMPTSATPHYVLSDAKAVQDYEPASYCMKGNPCPTIHC